MAELDDYRWLISPAGEEAIAHAAELLDERDLVTATSQLRKRYSIEQAKLVWQQTALRQRARAKFPAAQRMFFTDLSLQQASGRTIADYKANRFPSQAQAFDLCCGVGGDLFSLGARGPTVGLDRDEVTSLLAQANCAALGLTTASVRCADVTTILIDNTALVHIDPDRRPQGRRTTKLELHQPNESFLESLFDRCDGSAIKFAPAAEIPESWRPHCELEWISHEGECKQLVVWFGALAMRAGQRTATTLDAEGKSHSLAGGRDRDTPSAASSSIARYLYEPDSAVIAARLVGELALRYGLNCVDERIAYLTAEELISSPLLAAFEIIDQTAMDFKRVKAMLSKHDVGVLEIKKRGVDISPEILRRRLRPAGQSPATLIITPHSGRTMAILARRIGANDST